MTPTKVICGLVLLITCNFVFSTTPTSPVFLWSDTNVLKGKTQDITVVAPHQISNFLSKHSNEMIETAFPEVIVVFVEPKLLTGDVSSLAHANQANSNGGAFHHLKKYIEHSVSSRVYHYVQTSDIADALIRTLSSRAAEIFTLGEVVVPNSKPITLDQLKDMKFNHGKTNMIVVGFTSPAVNEEIIVHDQYAADDRKIDEILDSINAKYLAVLTSNMGTPEETETEPAGAFARSAHIQAFERQFAQNGDLLYTTYWPAGIIEALLVMWPFLIILFFGVCCTFQLQSDLKFDAERVMLRRQ